MTAWGKVPDRGLALARVAASGKACGARMRSGSAPSAALRVHTHGRAAPRDQFWSSGRRGSG